MKLGISERHEAGGHADGETTVSPTVRDEDAAPAGGLSAPATPCPGTVVEMDDSQRDRWDAFVRAAPNGHVFQGWSWGEYKRHAGWKPVRLAVLRDGEIQAAAQVLFRPVAGFSFAYVPRGPVVPVDRPEIYRQLFAELHRQARRRRAIYLKIEPNEPGGSAVEGFLCAQGFRPSRRGMRPEQPWATLMVDLSGGPEAVMAGIKPRIRRYVRAAERQLTVRQGRDETDIATFHRLVMELHERRDLAARPIEHYLDLLQEFSTPDEAILLLAERDHEAIAGVIVLAYGDEGTYLHGGSSSEFRDTHANHLLQWKAMEWCMKRGCIRYDMTGVFERRTYDQTGKTVYLPIEEQSMPPALQGIYRFKLSFGGEIVRYVGAFDLPYIAPPYLLWRRMPGLQANVSDALHTAMNRSPAPIRRVLRLPGRLPRRA